MDELNTLREDLEVVTELRKEIKQLRLDFEAIVTNVCDYERALYERIDELSIDTMELDELFQIHPDTKIKHDAREKKLTELSLSSNGYFHETNQVYIRIALYRDNDSHFEKVYESLQNILPVIKPLEDGYKHIDIFEHTLSEFGVYALQVHPDNNKARIVITRWGRDSVVQRTTDLRSALKYIQQNNYYGETKGEIYD